MASILIDDKLIHTDKEGFLTNPQEWDEQVAQELARSEGVEQLDGERLSILRVLRSHFEKHRSFPILASICRKSGSKRRDCVARKFTDPMKAWKIAGLPKPSNVFFTSFDGEHYIPNPFY